MAHQQQTMSVAPSRFGARLLWGLQIPIGATLAAVGAAMVGLAFSGSLGLGRQIFEVVLGVAVFTPGVLVVAVAVVGKRTAGKHLAAGELALAATILYLGEAMPPFHLHAVGHDAALAQFIAVVVGLVVGATTLALPAPVPLERPTGVQWGWVIRDSVILVVATIVVAIGISQTANPALMPPKWSWISFLGITIPGMLTLIFGRGGLKAVGRPGQIRRGVGVEVLLVVGLAIMVFGSVANLNLGASGFKAGFKGNATGEILWVTAAVFLVVVRGAFKLAVPDGDLRTAVALARKALYVVGAVAFLYGERSTILGKPPNVAAGGAFAAAAVMIIAGVVVLTYVRQAAKAM
ncbi:MAG: hypothetical protein M3Y91_16900, partial [Actinomycetota bacterium]|nr:hypothetical protein [Actinomycetota bacterium]